jgi:asparagine synthase (glutamine-hydrolysing)
MCGIAGLMLSHAGPKDKLAARAAAMNAALAHRGPDGEGVWTEAEAGVALAQRRLAIVDLSPTGAQPMLSASGRLTMTYNGEIYNFRELRRELEAQGVLFRGSSDSEVLLEAWDRWGGAATLGRLNGMFAIAMFDRSARTLTLARDRLGIKPLLWRTSAEGVFFASELRGLLADPACPRQIDAAAAAAFLRHGYVPAPWTILAGVSKLEPGTELIFRQGGGEPARRRFWSPLDAVLAGQASPSRQGWDELVAEGEALIADAVERQMVADVPLGAFLSGGIDSSLVAALMQRASSARIDTFTIGFAEKAWDESPHAEAVARRLGTRHHTLMTNGRAALDIAADMPAVYDEPFADSSQIPTTLLCRQVRRHVTVALSGDGGDEAFAGYVRYGWGLGLARLQARTPAWTRRMAALAVEAVPAAALEAAARLGGTEGSHAGHKAKRAARIAASAEFVDGYRRFVEIADRPPMRGGGEHRPLAYDPATTSGVGDVLSRMQAIDALSYLPDDILTKTDRASMSVGLEVRVPLLDHRVWEWSQTLHPSLRHGNGRGKALLRAILARHVPPALTERPKAGFAVPLATWLRGDLRSFAEELLAPASLESGGAVDAAEAGRLWREHLGGRHDHAPALWAVLMLEGWRRALPRTAAHG